MESKIKYIYSLSDLMKAIGAPTSSIGYFENTDGVRTTEFDFVIETQYVAETPECVECGAMLEIITPGRMCTPCLESYRGNNE